MPRSTGVTLDQANRQRLGNGHSKGCEKRHRKLTANLMSKYKIDFVAKIALGWPSSVSPCTSNIGEFLFVTVAICVASATLGDILPDRD